MANNFGERQRRGKIHAQARDSGDTRGEMSTLPLASRVLRFSREYVAHSFEIRDCSQIKIAGSKINVVLTYCSSFVKPMQGHYCMELCPLPLTKVTLMADPLARDLVDGFLFFAAYDSTFCAKSVRSKIRKRILLLFLNIFLDLLKGVLEAKVVLINCNLREISPSRC